MIDPGHSLTLGGMVLVEDGHPLVHEEGFITDLSADGHTWGNPEPAVTTLLTALRDGSVETTFRVANRTPVIYVMVEAPNGPALAAGEAALARIIGQPAELVWQPPDVAAPPTVWDVVNSRMDFEFDDQGELRRERVYRVTLAALPWGRSVEKVINEAIPPAVATTTVTVDDGTSLTGWSATATTGSNGAPGVPTLSIVSGALHYTYTLPKAHTPSIVLARSGLSVNMTGTPYLRVESATPYLDLGMAGTGIDAVWVKVGLNVVGGRWITYFQYIGVGTVTDLQFMLTTGSSYGLGAVFSGDIYDISRTDGIDVGTRRELNRTILPGGSVDAEGDIIVESPDATTLGHVAVYSGPADRAGALPLRPLRVSGTAETTNSFGASGKYNDLSDVTWEIYEIPVDLCPRGDVHMWAMLWTNAGTGDVKMDWIAESYQNTNLQGGSGQSGTTTVNIPAVGSGSAQLVPIARLSLPPSEISGPTANVRISVKKTTGYGGFTLRLDNFYLFGMDNGRLTVVDGNTDSAGGSGAAAKRLKVAAPSLSEPHGRISLATLADFTDAWSPHPDNVDCHQVSHRFPVEGTQVFVVTQLAQDCLVRLEHYPHWHTHAGS